MKKRKHFLWQRTLVWRSCAQNRPASRAVWRCLVLAVAFHPGEGMRPAPRFLCGTRTGNDSSKVLPAVPQVGVADWNLAWAGVEARPDQSLRILQAGGVTCTVFRWKRLVDGMRARFLSWQFSSAYTRVMARRPSDELVSPTADMCDCSVVNTSYPVQR